jgi:hypothetical protein
MDTVKASKSLCNTPGIYVPNSVRELVEHIVLLEKALALAGEAAAYGEEFIGSERNTSNYQDARTARMANLYRTTEYWIDLARTQA